MQELKIVAYRELQGFGNPPGERHHIRTSTRTQHDQFTAQQIQALRDRGVIQGSAA